MLTFPQRLVLIFILVALGMLFVEVKTSYALLVWLGAILVLVGHFRTGTVWLAFRRFRKGDLEGARRLLGSVRYPRWLNAQHRAYHDWMRGALALKDDLPAEAVRHLDRASVGRLRTENTRCGVFLTLAEALLELGEREKAREVVEAARSLPHSAQLDHLLDRVSRRLEQPTVVSPLTIPGKLVILRDPVQKDLPALIRWWTTDREWLEWDAPWDSEPSDEEVVRAKWERWLARPLTVPRGRMMIALPDGTPIGRVNLYLIDDDQNRMALGINIHESPLWGQGLGTEAFGLWLTYVAKAHKKSRLYCETWSGNVRMLKVAERLGFREIRRRKNVRTVRGEKFDAVRLAVEITPARRAP
jgi:RimJ/RimL family protein N-acetyltransferase